MGRARRGGAANASGAKAIGILLLGGFAIWVLAQIWMFLLAAAGLALAGWLIWTVTRKLRDVSPRPHIEVASAPSKAPIPETLYRALVPVDAKVFADTAQTESVAIAVFEAWLQDLPFAPRRAAGLIRSLQLRKRSVGRLLSEIVDRTAEWKEAPARAGAVESSAGLSLEAALRSTTSAAAIGEQSRHVTNCAPCAGLGVVTCPVCLGTTRGVCPECNGEGKAYGIAKNGSRRRMNCKSCNGGKDAVTCSRCTNGKASCSVCKGGGRIEKWLDVSETVRFDVQVEPDGNATRAYRWGKDGVAASRSEIEQDATVAGEVSADGALSIDAVRSTAPQDWLSMHWQGIQPKLKGTELVRRQSLWLLDVPSVELSYALPGATPTVLSLEGKRLLAPPSTLDSQFAPRAERIRILRYVLVGVLCMLPLAYMVRGAYFVNGWLAATWGCMAMQALALERFYRMATLGLSQARSWAIGAAVIAVALCGSAMALEPSARSVRRQLAAGQLQLAETELRALDAKGQGRQRALWLELWSAQMRQTKDLASATEALARIPDDSAGIREANQHVLTLGQAAVEQALAVHDLAAADRAVSDLSAALRKGAESDRLQSETAELRARLATQRLADCTDNVCRLNRSREVEQIASNPQRRQQLEHMRSTILAALEFREQPGEARLDRLLRLRRHLAYAALVARESADEGITPVAERAQAWATREREKVPMLGEERAIVAELLVAPDRGTATLTAHRNHVFATAVLKNGRCAGLYLVGDAKAARAIDDGDHAMGTAALMTQTFGRAVAMPTPPRSANGRPVRVTRRVEGATPIVARWDGDHLVELRVGDAAP